MRKLLELEEDFHEQGETVLGQLVHWAKHSAEAPCIYYGEQELLLSFAQFNERCDKTASGLYRLGVRKGDRVSVLSTNALVTATLMFASWKLGALYCPVNPAYRGDLLVYILNDARPRVLCLDLSLLAEVQRIRPKLLSTHNLVVHCPQNGAHDFDAKAAEMPLGRALMLDELMKSATPRPDLEVCEDDLASIIYTSGTTGNPKGVVHTHKWLHGYVYLSLKLHHRDDVIYSDLPLYHVAGAYFNCVRAVWAGCRLALWDRFSPGEFWQRVRSCGATSTMLIDVMIDWLMQAQPRPDDAANSLKLVGMMPLPANHNSVAKRFGLDFVHVGYGSTELGAGFAGLIDELGDDVGTPAELWKGWSKDEIRGRYLDIGLNGSLVTGTIGKGFIGAPSPLIEVRIVDDANTPAAPRIPGRPAFRHRLPGSLFGEYFGKAEATREAVRDGWYYPADLISHDGNGLCYFADRQQGFIRVRGENLSATSVEEMLRQHPAVERCAVVGVPAAQGGEEDVAAFIVPKDGAHLTQEELLAWTRDRLPKFMWPRHVRFVETLPLTPTFKVQKQALKQSLVAELAIQSPS